MIARLQKPIRRGLRGMSMLGSIIRVPLIAVMLCTIVLGVTPYPLKAASATLVGWSERGMYEMAGTDFSVFSLHPPGSTIHAQVMLGGLLVTNDANVFVTYQAIADPSGSINSTSFGKGNFYNFASALYGIDLKRDEGLAGFAMPGSGNTPQPMVFDAVEKWFTAVGIPVLPIDDAGRRNGYPMMRLTARNAGGTVLATTDIVLPVSDGLNCRSCHASGSQSVARPNGGWVWDCDPDRDYKLNVLQKHDDRHLGSVEYSNVLIQAGYDTAGLFVSATRNHKPVLCTACHPSNESAGSGIDGMRPLTQLMHAKHSYVADPKRILPLSFFNDSSVCLQCHSGPETRYLRGMHRRSVNADGALSIQCQDCHGNLLAVGRTGRRGWLDEPNCQSCHSGTAMQNNGQIRYTSVFDSLGGVRQAVNQTFATQPNTPVVGFSLFSHSEGHGGLKCAACHGPAHGEWPSVETNENVQSQQLQGNSGVLLGCTACHTTIPSTVTGGPHGIHSVGQDWAENHHDMIGEGDGAIAQCRDCHGSDFRGTVLSGAGTDNTFNARGVHHFWPGFRTGCYDCHRTPLNDTQNTNLPPVASAMMSATTMGNPVTVPLSGVDPEGAATTLHIVSPPKRGRVNLIGNTATYFPDDGFAGNDTFTYAALDGSTDSNLAGVGLTVNSGECALFIEPTAPRAALPNRAIGFRADTSLKGCDASIQFDWDFGDGTAHAASSNACHAYSVEGDYTWTLVVTAGDLSYTTNGVVTVSSTLGPPLVLSIENWIFQMNLWWYWDPIPTTLETSFDPVDPLSWYPVYDTPFFDPFSGTMSVQQFVAPDHQYFRLRRAP